MSDSLRRNITRVKEYKVENLSKMDEARSPNERKHYRTLAEKNQEMIDKYERRLKQNG